MSDLSVRSWNAQAARMADALLRAAGGAAAVLLVPVTPGDATDAGQIGLDAPQYGAVSLAPAMLRRTRAVMTEKQATRYELAVSATAVQAQVGALQVASAEALFAMAAAVQFCGLRLVIESWSCSAALGAPLLYRLLLRESETAL